MAQLSTFRRSVEHPPWCAVPYHGPDDHDPHISHRERVGDDFPSSDCAVEAYLLLPKQPPDSRQPKAALEFHAPGAEPVSFVLSFRQLRRLDEALCRLISQGEAVWPS